MVQLDPTQYLPLWLFDLEAEEDERIEAEILEASLLEAIAQRVTRDETSQGRKKRQYRRNITKK
jgi:hypothetical protein